MHSQQEKPYGKQLGKSMEARLADSSSSSEAESEHESDLVETSRDAFRATVQGQHAHYDAQHKQQVFPPTGTSPNASQFTFTPVHHLRASNRSMPMTARQPFTGSNAHNNAQTQSAQHKGSVQQVRAVRNGPLREDPRSAQRLVRKACPQDAPRTGPGHPSADLADDEEIIQESDLEDQDGPIIPKSRSNMSATATETAPNAHDTAKKISDLPTTRNTTPPRKVDLNDIWSFFGNDPFMSAWLANGFSQSRQKQTELTQLLSAIKGLVQEGNNRLHQEVLTDVSSGSQRIADVISRSLESYEKKLKGHSTFIDGMSNDLTKLLKDQSALQHDNWEKFQQSSKQFQTGLEEGLVSHKKTVLEAHEVLTASSAAHKGQLEACTKHQTDLQDAQNKLLQATCELEIMKTQLSTAAEATGLSSHLDDQMSTLRAELSAQLVEIRGRSDVENEKIIHALQDLESKVKSATTENNQDKSIELTRSKEALEKLQAQVNSIETQKQDAEARAKVLETEIAELKRQAAEVEVSKQVAGLQESFTSEIAKLGEVVSQALSRQARQANVAKAPREQIERETRSAKKSQDRDRETDKQQREQIAADLEKQSREARHALEEQIKGLEARMLQDNAERQAQSLGEIRVLREDREKDLEARNVEKQRVLEEQARFLTQQRKDKELYEKELKLKDDERQKALDEQHRLLDQQSAERETRLREEFDKEIKQRIAEVQKKAEAHMLEQIDAVKSQLQRSENATRQQIIPQPAGDIRPPTASPLSASSKENKAPADADNSQGSFVAGTHEVHTKPHIADTLSYGTSYMIVPPLSRAQEMAQQPQTRANMQVITHDYPRPPSTSSLAQAIPLVDPFGGDGRQIQRASLEVNPGLLKSFGKSLRIPRTDKPAPVAPTMPSFHDSRMEPSDAQSDRHDLDGVRRRSIDTSLQTKSAMFGMTWSPEDDTSKIKATNDFTQGRQGVAEPTVIPRDHTQRPEHSKANRKRKHLIEEAQESLPPSLRCKTPASLVSTRPGSTIHHPIAATYSVSLPQSSLAADDVRPPGTTRSKPKTVESRYHSTRGSSVQPRLGGGTIRLIQSSAPRDKTSQELQMRAKFATELGAAFGHRTSSRHPRRY